jgi:LPXTG-motif cell wall-anchored protein
VLISKIDGEIWVKGNVTSNMNGVVAEDGGIVVVDGEIDASLIYITLRIDTGQVLNLSADDFTTPTTRTGYLTYTDGVNTVWVAENTTPPNPPIPPIPLTPPGTIPATGDLTSLLGWLSVFVLLMTAGLLLKKRRAQF